MLVCACLSAYSQIVHEFSVVKQELNLWYSSIESASFFTSKSPKSIEFTTEKYSIIGVMAKGVLCDGPAEIELEKLQLEKFGSK